MLRGGYARHNSKQKSQYKRFICSDKLKQQNRYLLFELGSYVNISMKLLLNATLRVDIECPNSKTNPDVS